MSLLIGGIIAAAVGTTMTAAGAIMKGVGEYNDDHRNNEEDEEEDDDDD